MDKCPHCKTPKPKDEEFDNGTAIMGFTVDIPTGIWTWECFECNCEWTEKDKKLIEIIKKGE